MKYTTLIITVLVLFSCSTEGVKSTKNEELQNDVDTNKSNSDNVIDTTKLDTSAANFKDFGNGLKLAWELKNEEPRLESGDVVKIDFIGRISNGKIFDSSKKLKRLIPMRVGWRMQTEGWDLAMMEMAPGEKAKISIPSDLAYGDKGDGRKIPPNSDLSIELEIKEKLEPIFDSAGIKVYVVEEFLKDENPKAVKSGQKLMFDYFSLTDEGKLYDSSYEKGHSFVHFRGDKNLNFGLRKGLDQLKEGESAYIHVPAEHGFGKKGLKDLVKPNQDIMFIVTVKKVE